ncbi:MAG: hypothetical protein RJA10_1469, partial [Pseudomonadota bacterium]
MKASTLLPAPVRRIGLLILLCCLHLGAPVGAAELAPLHLHAGQDSVRAPLQVAPVDDAWRASLPRDAKLATQAYLDRLPQAAVLRSNDYDEGGYGLQLVEFVLGLAIAALMLHGGRSARVRDWAQRVGRHALLRDGL